MADIKEKQRAPIKILDKTKVGAERIKDNLVDVRTKNDLDTKWIDKGIIPKDSGYIPKCGDIIFFDWKDKKTGEQDGLADHTGIVEYTDIQTMKVHTYVSINLMKNSRTRIQS